MKRYGLQITDLAARAMDAVEMAERAQGTTVVLRNGHPIAAIVPTEVLDRAEPPDPGASGNDPLLALCGACKQDSFVEEVWLALGVPIPHGAGRP
ncbi:MAG: hypothetical protein U0165_20375 [Polyangiaceae bacterium]